MNFPVFDLHCDTALALLGRDFAAEGSLKKNQFHIDLERAATLPGYVQCFACFTTPMEKLPGRFTVEDMFEREMSVILRELNAHADVIRQVYSAEDIVSNRNNGLMSAILTIEGPAGFGFDPDLLENLSQIGFRFTTLGWNEKNVLTGSHVTGGGLTELGKRYVREAQKHGMVVDVSHISDDGFWDIMDITSAPIVATHSNSRAVYGVSRNLTDEMFQEICKTGGVAGFNFCAEFVGDAPTLDHACDHILHFVELDPEAKHIALGGDLDGITNMPDGFRGVQDYPVLAQRLLERGLDQQMVMNIFWNNALGVMQQCCM